MNNYTVKIIAILLLACIASCSPKISTRKLNAYSTVAATNVSYNEMTMMLDSDPISYTIDISNESGRLKLKNLSLDEACDLALVEAIMANKCATIFQPQYTHLTHKGKVLRITIYGYPARYRNDKQ